MRDLEIKQSSANQSVVVKFPPSWLHLARGAPRDIDQILGDNPRAVFACDGTMFESAAGHDAFLLVDSSAGINVPSKRLGEGMTISVENGVANAFYGGVASHGATVAVQTWPSLVRNGVAVPHDTAGNREHVWRIGLGIARDGKIMVVMLVGSMLDLSNRMVREGMANAGYLDGGSSLAAEARGVFRRTYARPGQAHHLIPGWVLATPPEGAPEAIARPELTVEDHGVVAPHESPIVTLVVAGMAAGLLYLILSDD